MIEARQHVPGFVDVAPKTATVATLADLLAVPWVAQWAEPGSRWLRSRAGQHTHLMIERADRSWWWVVATTDDALEGLPDWTAPGSPPPRRPDALDDADAPGVG